MAKFSLVQRIQSFRYAFAGLGMVLRTQHNAWIHVLATIVVIAAGLVFHVTAAEWCWLIIAVAMVWMAEAFNTAIELLCDLVTTETNPVIKKIKDAAAAGVLVVAISALLIGVIILGPYIAAVFKQ